MENDVIHTTELDNTIKNALRNYEADFKATDWARVETALIRTPKKSAFNWKGVTVVLVAIGVLAGSYFLFKQFPFNLFTRKPVVTVPPAPLPAPAKKPTPAPVQKPSANTALTTKPDTVVNEAVAAAVEEKNTVRASAEEAPTKKTRAERAEMKNDSRNSSTNTPETVVKKKREKNTENKKTGTASEITHQPLHSTGSSNTEPRADSLKTAPVAKETKEEETKTAAKPKPATSVGWNTLMFSNINADSLKKYRERMQKDTPK